MINSIANIIVIIGQHFFNFLSFLLSLVILIPKMLTTIFSNLPPFFQSGLVCFISFIIFVLLAKLVAMVWQSVKG